MRSILLAATSAALLSSQAMAESGPAANCRAAAIDFAGKIGAPEGEYSQDRVTFAAFDGEISFDCRPGLDVTATATSTKSFPGPEFYLAASAAGSAVSGESMDSVRDVSELCLRNLASSSQWTISEDSEKTRVNCSNAGHAELIFRSLPNH